MEEPLALTLLDAALRAGNFNEAALLLRRCEPQDAHAALALATPYRNKADLTRAYAELKEKTKGAGGKRK